jgi:hypothetical protein
MPLMIFTTSTKEKIALNTDHIVSIRRCPGGYYEVLMTDDHAHLVADDPETVVRRTTMLRTNEAMAGRMVNPTDGSMIPQDAPDGANPGAPPDPDRFYDLDPKDLKARWPEIRTFLTIGRFSLQMPLMTSELVSVIPESHTLVVRVRRGMLSLLNAKGIEEAHEGLARFLGHNRAQMYFTDEDTEYPPRAGSGAPPDLDPDDIMRRWPQIREQLCEGHMGYQLAFAMSTLVAVDGNTLVVRMGRGHVHLLQDDNQRRRELRGRLISVLGNPNADLYLIDEDAVYPPRPACPHGHPDCCGHHDLEDRPVHDGIYCEP